MTNVVIAPFIAHENKQRTQRGFGTRIRVAREANLEWFFGDGQSIFETSSFGALLERQAHYGQRLEDCDKCEASGFTKDDGTCRACKGLGGRPRRLKTRANARQRAGNLLLATSRCGACHGRTGCDCKLCKGEGYLVFQGVGSTASDRETPSYTPNEKALTKYAQVSRWLMRTPAWAVRVLEAYYGLDGYRWASTKWGRLMAVLPFTEAGRAMLAKLENPLGLPAHALLANTVDQIERMTNLERRRVLRTRVAKAIAEAMRLFTRAVRAWNDAVEQRRA